ncbi:peptidoglycan-binding domain-containing protein [Streptomyces sp. NPDC001450]
MLCPGDTDPRESSGGMPVVDQTGMAVPPASPAAPDEPVMPTTGHVSDSASVGRQTRPSASVPPLKSASAHHSGSSARCLRTLSPGDAGPDVKRLQQLLFGQGFTYVSPTGAFDHATLRGVTQYQHNRSLTGDPMGVFGPVTCASLAGG